MYRRQEVTPPYSKLYVSGIGDLTTDKIKGIFKEYGEVSYVDLLKTKQGTAFVKFEKRSQAAKAQDELHGKVLEGLAKPLHVSSATSYGEVPDLDNKLKRIFIKISQDLSQDSVRELFENYGQVKNINIVKDRVTGLSKGLAYVTYTNAYDAAVAMESCDPQYKPVYAEVRDNDKKRPREGSADYRQRGRSFHGNQFGYQQNNDFFEKPPFKRVNGPPFHHFNEGARVSGPIQPPPSPSGTGLGVAGPPEGSPYLRERKPLDRVVTYPHSGKSMDGSPSIPRTSQAMDSVASYPQCGLTRLHVKLFGRCEEHMVQRLFDVIPGLEYCDMNYDPASNSGNLHVKYSSPQSASYARDKWDGFEYPPGCPMAITLK